MACEKSVRLCGEGESTLGTFEAQSMSARKRELRMRFRRLRRELGETARREADDAIEQKVLALREFVQAEVVLSYCSVGDEVRTRGIIEAAWAAEKTVALPWCVPGTRGMRWYRVQSFDELARGSFGVLEPVPERAKEQSLSTGQPMLALVPGFTFDAAGFRLGYGGGFYDTFLAEYAGASVGLCRKAQLSEDLRALGAVDVFDQPVHRVVSG